MPIPRIIHQFWDKPTPSDDIAERMQSWRDNHPDWEHRLWNDDTVSDFMAERFGQEAVLCFHAAKLPAMRSDLLRLAVFAAEGGLYADADMASLRPVGDLADGEAAIRAEAGKRTGKAKLNSNFMLAAPGMKLFVRSFELALRNVRRGAFRLDVTRLTGPLLVTQVWWKGLTEEERQPYRLVDEEAFRSLVRPGTGALDYRRGGNHWLEEVRRRQIIDFAAARDRSAQTAADAKGANAD